mmetsp:Transcript_23941/g.57943  ORF Transcript_23941/g.57943 Transcript_23941/m.57943 type:complete len:203 (+) Transcript_23941:134-742(+)
MRARGACLGVLANVRKKPEKSSENLSLIVLSSTIATSPQEHARSLLFAEKSKPVISFVSTIQEGRSLEKCIKMSLNTHRNVFQSAYSVFCGSPLNIPQLRNFIPCQYCSVRPNVNQNRNSKGRRMHQATAFFIQNEPKLAVHVIQSNWKMKSRRKLLDLLLQSDSTSAKKKKPLHKFITTETLDLLLQNDGSGGTSYIRKFS